MLFTTRIFAQNHAVKKLASLLTVLLISFTGTFAQVLQNADFENWDIQVVNDLEGYETSVFESFIITGQENCVIDSNAISGFGVSLTTVAANGDTAFGYLINGDIDNLSGGQSYTDRPDSLVGYYKYDVQAGDTGLILISFRHGSTENGSLMANITGTQSTYSRFSMPITWTDTLSPDSLIFAAASSNAINELGITPGSELALDELRLINSNGDTLGAILNQSFENWNLDTSLSPSNWISTASDPYARASNSVIRSDSAYNGSYSVQLKTSFYDVDTILGIVANYDFLTQRGGSAFNRQVDTLYGYYRFESPGADSGFVYVHVFNQTDTIKIGKKLGPSASFSYFEIPINMPSTPDSIQVAFVSSAENSHTVNGSTFWVDQIKFKNCPLPDTPSVIIGPDQICSVGELVDEHLYYVQSTFQIDRFDWQVGGQTTIGMINDLQDSIYLNRVLSPSVDTSIELMVRAENFCGLSPWRTKMIQLDSMPDKATITTGTNDSLVASSIAPDYMWFHDGFELSARDRTIKGVRSGSYEVIAINQTCVSDTSDPFDFTRSSLQSHMMNGIKVYPNPTSNIINIDFETADPYDWKLLNVHGECLKIAHVKTESGFMLDLSELTKGVYWLSIKNFSEQKVIKVVLN